MGMLRIIIEKFLTITSWDVMFHPIKSISTAQGVFTYQSWAIVFYGMLGILIVGFAIKLIRGLIYG